MISIIASHIDCLQILMTSGPSDYQLGISGNILPWMEQMEIILAQITSEIS